MDGLHSAFDYPLFQAIPLAIRRERRLKIQSVCAGSLTYTSDQIPQPLSPLEEAVLIAATG